jgi:ClpP class serine protease
MPENATELDLYLVSNGGDGTVAWRIVSLIRERVRKFSVLVPQAAFSAATLIALGADEIVMHPYGNLGPTDPQIHNRNKNVQFGAQDLAAFLTFARDEVGLTDQAPLLELFKKIQRRSWFRRYWGCRS